jgi:hypothetical protein
MSPIKFDSKIYLRLGKKQTIIHYIDKPNNTDLDTIIRLRTSGLFKEAIKNTSEFLSEFPLYGKDPEELFSWKTDCMNVWEQTIVPFINHDELSTYEKSLLWCIDENQKLFANVELPNTYMSSIKREDKLDSLINRPQMAQRSQEWYADADICLTASQFSTLFKGPRVRGTLVLEKAKIIEKTARTNRISCLSKDMSPFDWGIRFEPVIRQIYCDLTKTDVVELGRLRHQTDPKLAASPDGLVTKDLDESSTYKRVGTFVEFKAPVTRVLNKKVPEDYYMQMQIQMEVGDVDACDYFEVKFKSQYNSKPFKQYVFEKPTTTPSYTGVVYVIGLEESQELLRYEYSPLHDMEWQPLLKESETIMEKVEWASDEWWLSTVQRSKSWFSSVQPHITQFWLDVEKAKKGEFVLPESSRKRKQAVCGIIDEPVDQPVDQPADQPADQPITTSEEIRINN